MLLESIEREELSGVVQRILYNRPIPARQNWDRRVEYSHDSVDQVTGVLYDATNPDSAPSAPLREVSYAFDPVGNRTSVTVDSTQTSYTANNLNQYTAVGALYPTYDSNGNMVTYNGWTYSFDAQNRLICAYNSSTKMEFGYDARNRRVHNKLYAWDSGNWVLTSESFNCFNNWNLIEERNSNGDLLAKYIHGAGVDELLAKITSSETVYYHHDALGNVTHLTNEGGAVVEKYSYDIYGAPTITTVSGGPYNNRFLFTGREYLSDIQLYDYRNRFYMSDIEVTPDLGRFLQTDPIRFNAGDANFYRYVGNNPVSWFDPPGLVFSTRAPKFVEVISGDIWFLGVVDPVFHIILNCRLCSNNCWKINEDLFWVGIADFKIATKLPKGDQRSQAEINKTYQHEMRHISAYWRWHDFFVGKGATECIFNTFEECEEVRFSKEKILTSSFDKLTYFEHWHIGRPWGNYYWWDKDRD